jgi:dTDP-glucose 4,6-dehydratase
MITQALTQPTMCLGNLEARRDLTYVSDTVAGFLCAAETPDIDGETFNLGSGTEIRIADLANEIIALIGKPVEIQVDPGRLRPEKSEVQRLLSDNRLARQRLGWSPHVDLRTGLAQTIEWIKEHLHLYQPSSYQI